MRVPPSASQLSVFLALTMGLAGVNLLQGQQMNNPLGQLPTPQKTQSTSKPREQNPAGPVKKDAELPDPTKDPSKDPAKDITRDPTKDADPSQEPPAEAEIVPADQRGADQPGGTTEAPDYTGPSILSRGFVISRPAVIDNTKFRGYVGVNAVYDSGLFSAYTQDGKIPTTDSTGVDLNWGISGRKYRRKDIFDLTYGGHFYQYHQSTTSGGQDHSISAGYTHEFSPRLTVAVREVGGLYSNDLSVLNSVAITDTSLNSALLVVSPNTEAFNDRTYYSTTQGQAIYQISARLSISAAVAGFLVKRDSRFLADSTGDQYSGDIAYRISRRQTIGMFYAHTDYQYTKVLSNSHADSYGGTYSVDISRGTQLSTRFGVTRIDTQGLETVTLNPYLQSILGITTGVEKFNTQTVAPDFSLTLNRTVHHSSFGVSYVAGITPGNGLVLTSRRQSGSASWTYSGFRKYSIATAVGRDQLSGYLNTIGAYASYFGRVTATRTIGRNLSSVMTFDYRQQSVDTSGFRQKEWRISLGVRYSPSDLLRF